MSNDLFRIYDRFQKEAVDNITADFKDKLSGRYLLVVPTGGGKTYTAVRAVHQLYATGVLRWETDRVMWVAHRTELLDQARKTFRAFGQRPGVVPCIESIDFCMVSQVNQSVRSPEVRLAVVDEAHHGAAKSYQPLFQRPDLGILGLTATPSRHDGMALDFSKESFSIGFPDLIRLGVLLRPEVIRIEGERFDLSDLSDRQQLEQLNTTPRNMKVVNAILDNRDRISKAIVYVATVTQARDLYRTMIESDLSNHYACIAFITGEQRRRYLVKEARHVYESREDFIAAVKATPRTIVVNVDVLTEGYDDPTVNTVVMARPTRSKLQYMQAMGRAVRLDPATPGKRALLFEVVDELPNIRYRIDNRWLYADVSDVLEPRVVDRPYESFDQLPAVIQQVCEEYHVPAELRPTRQLHERDRVTMLLFRVYKPHAAGKYIHTPILITNANRTAVARTINFLSNRMAKLKNRQPHVVFPSVKQSVAQIPELSDRQGQQRVLHALEHAYDCVVSPDDESSPQRLGPDEGWFTFVNFQHRPPKPEIPEDLDAFLDGMTNRTQVKHTVQRGELGAGYTLLKLPLPVGGYWGYMIKDDDFDAIGSLVARLREIPLDSPDQVTFVAKILGESVIPLPSSFVPSIPTIVRENLDYFRSLDCLDK